MWIEKEKLCQKEITLFLVLNMDNACDCDLMTVKFCFYNSSLFFFFMLDLMEAPGMYGTMDVPVPLYLFGSQRVEFPS